MLTLPASGRAVRAISADYQPNAGDLGAILNVTASGSPVTISLPGTLPAGFWCFILRNAASTANVNAGTLRALTQAGELCEVIYDGSAWQELQRGSAAGGAAGQYLTKVDGTDYNTQWSNAPALLSLLFDTSEISITGATTATIQRAHVCSGTSADYSVTLPTPAAGKLIAVRMDSALTKLVTLDAGSGKTIDGQQTRAMWANETCILLGVSSTVWVKIAGKSIPMRSRMYLSGNQGSLSNGAYGDVNINTVATGADPAAMANTSAHTITIRRGGLYRLIGQISYYGGATTWNQLLCAIWAGTTNIIATELDSQGFSYGAPTFPASMQYVASAGDALKLRYYQSSSGGVPVVYSGSNATFLEVEELLSW